MVGGSDAVVIVGVIVFQQVFVNLLGKLRRDGNITISGLEDFTGEIRFIDFTWFTDNDSDISFSVVQR